MKERFLSSLPYASQHVVLVTSESLLQSSRSGEVKAERSQKARERRGGKKGRGRRKSALDVFRACFPQVPQNSN